jgi:acyl-CoA thioesterase-1
MSRGKKRSRWNRRESKLVRALKLGSVGLVALVTAGLTAAALTFDSSPTASSYEARPMPTFGTPPDETTAVVLIGDSYTAGTGASEAGKSWASIAAASEDWSLTNVARGGTGYVTTVTENAMTACGLDYCPSFGEMITPASESAPAMVVVSGGRNDSDLGASDEADAVTTFYSELRAALPEAVIIAVSPLWDASETPDSLDEIAADVRAAALAAGGSYLDVGQPLAGRADAIATDGIHPNDIGHALIASAITAALPPK